MAWLRIDDKAPRHPKMLKAGPVACWLWVCGNAYCSEHLTDGFLSTFATKSLPVRGAIRLAKTLVSVGLWDVVPGGYRVHDYHDYNPSKMQVSERRKRANDRLEAWRKRRGYAHGNGDETPFETPFETLPETALQTPMKQERNACPVPVPVPVPVPQEPKNKIKNSGCATPPVENPAVNPEFPDPPEPALDAPPTQPRAPSPSPHATTTPSGQVGDWTPTRIIAPFAVVAALVRSVLAEGRDWSYDGGEADLMEELKTRCARARLGYDTELLRKALDSERHKAKTRRTA